MGPDMKTKNAAWVEEVGMRKFKNQELLVEESRGKKVLYGLEAESVSGKRIAAKLEEIMGPLVGKSEDLLKMYELRQLDEAIKALIVHSLT